MARTRGGITCAVDDGVAEQMMQQINQESEKVIKEEIDPIVTKLRFNAIIKLSKGIFIWEKLFHLQIKKVVLVKLLPV